MQLFHENHISIQLTEGIPGVVVLGCARVMGLAAIYLFAQSAWADEQVPPKAAGLWEFKIENFYEFAFPDYTAKLNSLPERARENFRLRMEALRKQMTPPKGPQISRRCIATGDPKVKLSPEVENMLAKTFTCYSSSTTKEGDAYIVTQNCATVEKSMILKTTYRGDLSKRVVEESYSNESGSEKLEYRWTMRRLGDCPKDK